MNYRPRKSDVFIFAVFILAMFVPHGLAYFVEHPLVSWLLMDDNIKDYWFLLLMVYAVALLFQGKRRAKQTNARSDA